MSKVVNDNNDDKMESKTYLRNGAQISGTPASWDKISGVILSNNYFSGVKTYIWQSMLPLWKSYTFHEAAF